MSNFVRLNKEKLPNLDLLTWIPLYDAVQRGNYALEFLTAATDGTIPIPNAEKYPLPEGIGGKNLDDTVVELVKSQFKDLDETKLKDIIRGRRNRMKKDWSNGVKPWAIKSLDVLRENHNSEYSLDLLKPGLYDGTKAKGGVVPYAISSLPGLVYLYASALISGWSKDTNPDSGGNLKAEVVINPNSRLTESRLMKKLEEVCTKDREVAGTALKQPYGNLLQLLGLPQGDIVELSYEHLGLNFIENLQAWTKEGRLKGTDLNHATKALSRYVEAFMDHRYGRYPTRHSHSHMRHETGQIFLPHFRQKETRDKFAALFFDVWSTVNPGIHMSMHDVVSNPNSGKLHGAIISFLKGDLDIVESLYPLPKPL